MYRSRPGRGKISEKLLLGKEGRKKREGRVSPLVNCFAQEHFSPKANPETAVSIWHMISISNVYNRLQQIELTFRQLKPHLLSYVSQGKTHCLVEMFCCCWVAACFIIRDGEGLCGISTWRNFRQLGAYGLGTSLFACFCIAWVSVCAYFS